MICVPRPPERERLEDVQSRQASRCAREWITHRNWRWFAPGAQIAAGYLKPVLGCLRRNRRRAFAAAVTRYLKPVYAAEPVGIEDFARRQTLGTWPRKVTRELSEGWLVPTLPPPGTCGCNHRAPGRQWQADPARRAARSPSTGSGAAAEPFQHPETATRSNEARVGTRGPQLARDAPAATCLRRKNARLPGIICGRLQITADLSGCGLEFGQDAGRPDRGVMRPCGRGDRRTPMRCWRWRCGRGSSRERADHLLSVYRFAPRVLAAVSRGVSAECNRASMVNQDHAGALRLGRGGTRPALRGTHSDERSTGP